MLGGYYLTPQTNPPTPWPTQKFAELFGREVNEGMVVPRLERHFQQLQQAQAPHWRDNFHQTLQQALLAELDLRLQPAQGLLDALGEAA